MAHVTYALKCTLQFLRVEQTKLYSWRNKEEALRKITVSFSGYFHDLSLSGQERYRRHETCNKSR